MRSRLQTFDESVWQAAVGDQVYQRLLDNKRRLVLITGHRRENFGQGFIDLCSAIKTLAIAHPDYEFIYPVHLNPNVQKPVFDILSGVDNIALIEPLDYLPFTWLMDRSSIILTDSGGIQGRGAFFRQARISYAGSYGASGSG